MVTELILTLLSIILGMTPDAERYDAGYAGEYDSIIELADDNGWTVFEDFTIAP